MSLFGREWTAGLFFFLCVKSFDVCVCAERPGYCGAFLSV